MPTPPPTLGQPSGLRGDASWLGDAELVAFGIGHDGPCVAVGVSRRDLASAKLDELVDGLLAVSDREVEVDPVLDGLCNRGREVIRASIESFLLPRAQRYRRGEDSPEGCYHDSFDFDALHRVLLDPLGPDGDRRFQQAVYDRDRDTALSPPVTTAAADSVLLFDGVFFLRPDTDRPVGPVHIRVRRV